MNMGRAMEAELQQRLADISKEEPNEATRGPVAVKVERYNTALHKLRTKTEVNVELTKVGTQPNCVLFCLFHVQSTEQGFIYIASARSMESCATPAATHCDACQRARVR
jgi:hypothetical protein